MTNEYEYNPDDTGKHTINSVQSPVTITGLDNDVEYTVTLVTHLTSGFTMTETRRLRPSQFAIAGLTADQIRAMSTADIIALGTDISILNPDALGALSSAQLHAITTAQAASFGSNAIAALDCSAFNGLTTTSLHLLSASAISGMTTCQAQTLDANDLNAINSNIANLNTTTISSLNSQQIPLLSTSQIAVLPVTSIGALSSSAVSALTSSQVSSLSTSSIVALGPNVANLNTSAINSLSTSQISALTTAQVAAFTSEDIMAMSTSTFDALNYADLEALSWDAVAGITTDQMATLSTADIVALGTDIANLSFDAMGQLTSAQFAALTPDQVSALDVLDFAALSSDALSALTPLQASALTKEQVAAMSASGFNALSTAALAALTWDAVSGITAAQVDTLSTADILALGTDIANLTTEAMASLDAAQFAVITTDQFAAFDSSDIHALASAAFDQISTASLAALTSDAVAGITSEQVDTLDTTDIQALGVDIANLPTDAMASLDSTQLNALTTDQFAAFDRYDIAALSSTAIAGLTSAQIAAMSELAFDAFTLEDLDALTSDAVAGITPTQVDTLSSADIQALGTDIANMNTDAMASLDCGQIRALTTDQVAALDSIDISALSSDVIKCLSSEQVAAMSTSSFNALTTAELTELTYSAIAGITTAQIATLNTADIQALGTDISNLNSVSMASLNSTQVGAITTAQIMAFDTADIRALGTQIANLSSAAISKLTSTQIAALTTTQVAAFDSADIAAMTTSAFSEFGTDDLSALTSDAVAGITPTQVDTLISSEIQALGTDIANMNTAAMASLDSTQLQSLTTSQFAAFDATDIAALSSTAISGLTSSQIAVLTPTAFNAFTTEDLAELSFSAVAGITTAQVGTLDTADIQALGTDISNLSSSSMASLNSTQVGAITTSQIMAFDTADIRALGTQIANLSSDAISKLTTTQITALTTSQVAAFDSADITALTTEAFDALTTADLVALTSNAVSGITSIQVDTLSTSDIQAIGADIANMNTSAIASLDCSQVQALTTSQIAAFDTVDITALSSDTIGCLTSEQVAAMTPVTFNALSSIGLAELSFSAVAGITTAQVGTLDTADIAALGTDIANLSSAAMATLTSTQIGALQNTQIAAFGTEDYAALGITGVTTTSMINLMQSVTAAKPSADVNSKTELQALSDAASYIMTVAALNSSTSLSSQLSTMPTFKAKLQLLGVTGVTDQNIKAIWVAVRDSADSGSSVDTLTKLQAITDVANDSPILLPSATARSYTEQASPVILNDDLILSDVDNANLVGATVTISSGYTADDTLAFTAADGITGSFSQPTLTLSGTATVAQYQTALRSVTFYSSSDNPTATSSSRTFTWQVDDGTTVDVTNLSDPATSTLTIIPVNDAPTFDKPLVNQTAEYNTPFTYTFAADTFSDVDNATLSYTATLADGSALPSWLTLTSNTRTFSGTPLDTTDLSVKVIASDGSLTANGTFTISMQPVILSVAITGATGAQNGYVNAGDVVTSTVTFSEAVTVTGSPQLALNIGGTTVQATYNNGSGTSALTFNYTILAGQTDTNGISIGANALSLNGGTIVDANSNTAIITSSAISDNSSYKVDTTAPLTPSAPTTYNDNVGIITSSTSNKATTDDTTPGINIGTGLADTPKLYIGGSLVASTYDSGAGTLTPNNALSDGTYSFTYTLSDAAGNESLPSSPLSITIDHTPPATPSIAPYSYINGNGDFSIASRTQYVFGLRVNNYANVSMYKVYGTVGGTEYNIAITSAVDQTDPTKMVLSFNSDPGDGSWVFKYTIFDEAGNESGKSPGISVTADSRANIVSITPSWGTTLNVTTASSNGTVTAVTDNVENGQVVTFTLNGIDYTAAVSNNSATATIPSADLLNLTSSSYTIHATVSDVLGNSDSEYSNSFTVNFTPTIVSVSSSWGGDGILTKAEKTSNGTVTVTTSNVINGKSLDVTINGVTHSANVSNNSVTVTFTSAELTAMTGGTYTYNVSVANITGYPATDSSHSFKVLIFETLGDGDSTHGYWIAGSGSSKMIVAPKSMESSMIWGPMQQLSGITSTTDGNGNTQTMYAYSPNFPAGDYCANYNGSYFNVPSGIYTNGWFLPSITELGTCLNGRTYLPSGQGFEISTLLGTRYRYWSSTETDSDHAKQADILDWGDGTSTVVTNTSSTKDTSQLVRPIRYTDSNE